MSSIENKRRIPLPPKGREHPATYYVKERTENIMNKQSPVGVAQSKVLEVLNRKAIGSQDADQIFAQYGLIVSSKRIGKTSQPVIRMMSDQVGGFNAYGEGDVTTRKFENMSIWQAAVLAQWM